MKIRPHLTPQSIQYLQNKLTVEVDNKIVASASEWDQLLTQSIHTSRTDIVIRESKKWEAYRGGFKISEADFFATARLYEQSNAAKRYQTTTNLLGWGGTILALGGLVMTVAGIEWVQQEWGEEMKLNTLAYVGLANFSIGFVMYVAALARPNKKFPVSFAVEAADDYNKRLKKSLE